MTTRIILFVTLITSSLSHPTHKIAHKRFQLNQGFPEEDIVGGKAASPGDFPYQAGLTLYTDKDTFVCGGSIVSDVDILTAAHCVTGDFNLNSVEIGVGSNKRDGSNGGTLYVSNDVKWHESYDNNAILNDIAFIYVSTIIFNDNTMSISLTSSEPANGTKVTASGYGKRSDYTGAVNDLYYIENMTTEKCSDPHPSKICVDGVWFKSTCGGDSGGPLVNSERSVLYGVVSYGSAFGCQWGFQTGYANVAHFKEWIKSNAKGSITFN